MSKPNVFERNVAKSLRKSEGKARTPRTREPRDYFQQQVEVFLAGLTKTKPAPAN